MTSTSWSWRSRSPSCCPARRAPAGKGGEDRAGEIPADRQTAERVREDRDVRDAAVDEHAGRGQVLDRRPDHVGQGEAVLRHVELRHVAELLELVVRVDDDAEVEHPGGDRQRHGSTRDRDHVVLRVRFASAKVWPCVAIVEMPEMFPTV